MAPEPTLTGTDEAQTDDDSPAFDYDESDMASLPDFDAALEDAIEDDDEHDFCLEPDCEECAVDDDEEAGR